LETWSGEWDSADGMTTVLTKQRRGGWRLENGRRRQRKGGGVLETATWVWGRHGNGEEETTTRAAGRARKGTNR
jgi:hypothetical protein